MVTRNNHVAETPAPANKTAKADSAKVDGKELKTAGKAPASPTDKSSGKEVAGKAVEGEDKDFSAELSLAGAAAAQSAQKPVAIVAEAQPIQHRASIGTDSAEKNPLTQSKAASMNTGVSMTGLKPWNKDWVFDGQDENPNLKGLISSAAEKTATAQNMKVQATAQDLQGPQAAQVTQAQLAPHSVRSKRACSDQIPTKFSGNFASHRQSLARGDETQQAMALNAKKFKANRRGRSG